MKRYKLTASTAVAAALLASIYPLHSTAKAEPTPTAPAETARDESRRPNVLLWLLDDVGFAQLSSFGGLVATPNIDRIAARGLRFSNYRTTAICSSTRAALLTGRNAHNVHMGAHPIFASDSPGYDGRIPASAGTLAENLRQSGYATFALGKWDHLPIADTGPTGPHTYWPLGQGFERYYGFLASEMDNFHPLLVRDNTPVDAPRTTDYHLNKDLADEAIALIRSRDGKSGRSPFFLYLATGTAHAPHHASQAWIDKYRGKFDQGWDKAREQILERQIAQGLVPKGTRTAPRPAEMQAWDSLSADEKKLLAREMEVFAAALSEADAEFGRILDELEARGELSNTIIIITSDNGASAEGSTDGSHNELLFARGKQPSTAENMPYFDRWGSDQTYPHYAFGWAVAGNTPFRYYKQTTYEGGIHVPLIVAAPQAPKNRKLDAAFVHVSDIVPTVLDLAGVKPAEMVNNTPQMPFDGVSFAGTLRGTASGAPRKDQHFETFGHRAFWSDGWKIVSPSRLNVWDIMSPSLREQPWQLYDLRKDPGETTDLARWHPEIVERLSRGFDEQARKYQVYPIVGQYESFAVQARKDAAEFARRNGEWIYPGPISRIPKLNAPPIDRRSFTAAVDLDLPHGNVTGPVFAFGGSLGGMSFFLKDGQPRFALRGLDGTFAEIRATEPLPRGHSKLSLRLERAEKGRGKTITISVGDRVIVRSEVEFDIASVVPETFDIGRDDGTAVSPDYAANTPLPGELRNLSFKFQ